MTRYIVVDERTKTKWMEIDGNLRLFVDYLQYLEDAVSRDLLDDFRVVVADTSDKKCHVVPFRIMAEIGYHMRKRTPDERLNDVKLYRMEPGTNIPMIDLVPYKEAWDQWKESIKSVQ